MAKKKYLEEVKKTLKKQKTFIGLILMLSGFLCAGILIGMRISGGSFFVTLYGLSMFIGLLGGNMMPIGDNDKW